MRVLVMPSPVPTHLAPLIPLGWALVAAGHEVLVAGRPNVVSTATGAGFAVAPVGDHYDESAQFASVTAAFGAETDRVRQSLGTVAAGWRARVEPTVAEFVALGRAFAPDLILADPLEFGANLLSGVLGVPLVCHRWGVDGSGPLLLDLAATALADAVTRAGLATLPRPALTLDPCPAGLQSPALPPGEPIRFVPYGGGGVLPAWVHRPAGPRRVCLSLGRITLDLYPPEVFRPLLAGLAALPGTEVLVTVDAAQREVLGTPGGAIRLIDPLPLNRLLPGCAAVIHHGGSGTLLTAAALGVPQLVLPFTHSLAVGGQQVRAAGVGIAVDGGDPVTVAVATCAALDRLLREPGFAAAAGKTRDEMAAMPSPHTVVARLESLADPEVGRGHRRA